MLSGIFYFCNKKKLQKLKRKTDFFHTRALKKSGYGKW